MPLICLNTQCYARSERFPKGKLTGAAFHWQQCATIQQAKCDAIENRRFIHVSWSFVLEPTQEKTPEGCELQDIPNRKPGESYRPCAQCLHLSNNVLPEEWTIFTARKREEETRKNSVFYRLPNGYQTKIRNFIEDNAGMFRNNGLETDLQKLTSKECLEYLLAWEGLGSYTALILSAVSSAYGVELK
jgi:hypothetical protein